jgi:quercetin dioxygenase-like cupin family protein
MTNVSTTSGIERLSVSRRGNASLVQRWDLLDLDAPDGTRDPIVLHSDDGARAVLIVLSPGQRLGDHQVKENAWVTVLDGEVEISGGDAPQRATRGTMFRFEPDERHALRSDGGARVLMLLAPWPGAGHYRGGDR